MTAPLVSAIMPTRGRAEWAHQALRCFLRQSYDAKELIILDDLAEPSFEESIRFFSPQVLYLRLPHSSIGDKRNRCAELARGPLIMHFDSDDWSAPGRMAEQAALVENAGVAAVGFHSLLFYDGATDRWGKYKGLGDYALGTSLCYRREWWQAHPFQALSIGEDNDFVATAHAAGQLRSIDGGQSMVARIHAGNTSRKDICSFDSIAEADRPAAFFL